MELKLKRSCPCNQVKICFLKDNNQSAKGAGGVKVASKIDKTFGPVDFFLARAGSRKRHYTFFPPPASE